MAHSSSTAGIGDSNPETKGTQKGKFITVPVDKISSSEVCTYMNSVHALNAGTCSNKIPKTFSTPITGNACGENSKYNQPKSTYTTVDDITPGKPYEIDLRISAAHGGYHVFALCQDEANNDCLEDQNNWLKVIKTDSPVKANPVIDDYYVINNERGTNIDYSNPETQYWSNTPGSQKITVDIPKNIKCTNNQCVIVWMWM